MEQQLTALKLRVSNLEYMVSQLLASQRQQMSFMPFQQESVGFQQPMPFQQGYQEGRRKYRDGRFQKPKQKPRRRSKSPTKPKARQRSPSSDRGRQPPNGKRSRSPERSHSKPEPRKVVKQAEDEDGEIF